MPQQPLTTLENNFIQGLKTEFTGLNFPENAVTDTENCIYTLIGDVTRRGGINFEENYTTHSASRSEMALSSYKWLNAGGDGETQVYVEQIGNTLYFYQYTNSTIASPMSTTLLASTVNIANFLAAGSTNNPSNVECQYSDGNGYLFVYHPYCDPFYCTFSSGLITPNVISMQIRDFTGYPESIPTNQRPSTLTNEHNYNIQNQGWTSNPTWTTGSNSSNLSFTSNPVSAAPTLGNHTFTVAASLGATPGEAVSLSWQVVVNLRAGGTLNCTGNGLGVVVSYSGTTMVVDINAVLNSSHGGSGDQFASEDQENWSISILNTQTTITTWFSAVGSYPSDADIWWLFKDDTGVFNPATTIGNIQLPSAQAPQGHFILNAFNQNQAGVSGISGLTSISTLSRPTTGCWFQGRVWYTGINASQPPTGDQNYYTWTENIYFSQEVTTVSDFSQCYQTNDPTDENFFDLLPTDGGVITIQGAGSIDKLFPIQNGLLAFAANGIWFITGSQGIGFSATDYTITKISSVQSIADTSYVNVLGWPVFWNEEGIYTVTPSKNGGGLTVTNIALGTILTYYGNIPLQSKKFVRGDYDPINFIIQWCFRSTNETDVTSRYQFDTILCYNTSNNSFYPYVLPKHKPYIHDIKYIVGPGGSTSPDPLFKYMCSYVTAGSISNFSFAEENDFTNWVDWFSYDNAGINYSSYFVTGYKLHGKAITKFQPQYIRMYLRNPVPSGYYIQGIWDYANLPISGRFSTAERAIFTQTTFPNGPTYGMVAKRHRIRGHGYVLQIRVTSIDGLPFDIMGWATYETVNASV